MNIKKAITGIAIVIMGAGGVYKGTIPKKIPDPVELNEIIAERTANAKIFDISNNQRYAKVYSTSIHYKDEDGSFKKIDTQVYKRPLLTAIFSEYEYWTDANIYVAFFDKDKPWDYRLEAGDNWIEFEALFEESDVLTIEVETTKRGVKETITLKDDTAPTTLKWLVKSFGLQPDAPTAWDAELNVVPVTYYTSGDTLIYEIDTTNAIYPITVDPSTSVETTNDGTIYKNNIGTYSSARDVIAGSLGSWNEVGQNFTGGNQYEVKRSFLSFAIPNMGSISAASLFLEGQYNGTSSPFNIYIHTSTYSTPKVSEDFDQFDGWTSGFAHTGTILNSAWGSPLYSAGWNEIVFAAAGRTAIFAKRNDTFKMAVISDEDYNYSPPADSERIQFATSADANREPYLSITYTEAGHEVMGLEGVSEVMGVESVVEIMGVTQ